MRRQIQLFSVTGLAPNAPWFATGGDFEASYLGTCGADQDLVLQSAPYAFRFGAERLLNVVYESRESLLNATFLYEHQQKAARTLVSIPYESLADVAWEVTPDEAAPCFVFSMGRCGSTLLSKLLGGMGLPSLSEPDVFTQYSMALPKAGAVPGFDHIHSVFGYVVSSLLSAAGSATGAIKFRAQTNSMADQLMTALPKARGLMLVREFDAWASSLYRTFSFVPETIADTLACAHQAVHACSQVGRPLELVRYEDLCERPLERLQELGQKLGVAVDEANESRIRQILSEDSQADTPLGREAKRGVDVPEGFLSEVRQQWAVRKAHLEGQGVVFQF